MYEYAAVIYDPKNIIVRVEERPDEKRARKAGDFFTRTPGYWYWLAVGRESIEMYKAMINA